MNISWLTAVKAAAPGRNRRRRRLARTRGVSARCTLLAAPGPARWCDHTAVGVLITGPGGRVLLAGPGGLPLARHLPTGQADPVVAARAVAGRFGAGGTALQLTGAGGWRADRCDRGPGPRGAGHQWWIYNATTSGAIDPAIGLVPAARWISRSELQELAGQAATGGPGAACPIDPVWVGFLARLGLIQLSPWALSAADYLARRGPMPALPMCAAGRPELAGQGRLLRPAGAGWLR